MNFKMKAVVAALALTASMSASADLQQNTYQVGSITKTGNSSVIMTLLDTTNQISATFDLGYNFNTFNQQANAAWDLTSGDYSSAWNTFWATAKAGTTQWAVAAGDAYVADGSVGLFTTGTAASSIQRSVLASAFGNFDKYIADNNLLQQGVVNGASTATSGNAYAATYAYNTAGSYGAKLTNDSTIAMDTNAFVYKYSAPNLTGITAINGVQVVTTAGFNPYFNLSSTGALTYTAAAVPEADTWAMLLAGLGLMGFIARRRTAV